MTAPQAQLSEQLHTIRGSVEQALGAYLLPQLGVPKRLNEALRYSVLAPGKRLRPTLVLLACEAVSGAWESAIPAACAVEFVHVYSLIHDDLPAMDNDEMRRGRATCHVQFDEATAILAGDALPMLAIEIMCRDLEPTKALACCRILSEAAGQAKLVGGQVDDLAAEGRWGQIAPGESELEFLKNIHRRKTSALIEASLQLGGVVGDASLDHLERLLRYGQSIGLAFQIVDDCLDVESTPEQMGKQTRKDSTLGKLTYPSLLGLEESRRLADKLIGDACDEIAVLGDSAKYLINLARFVVERRS